MMQIVDMKRLAPASARGYFTLRMAILPRLISDQTSDSTLARREPLAM
jgi:hypothetical protein